MAVVRFEGRKKNDPKLLAYGFQPNGDALSLCRDLADGQMRLDLSVHADGSLTSKVTDTATDEEYVLHLVPDAAGSFVGRVRNDYQTVLDDVCASCYDFLSFGDGQAKALADYVKGRYRASLEFLWGNSPDAAIWRRDDNRKWFGIMMVVSRRKLGFDSDERVAVMNFKHDAKQDGTITDGAKYFPAYHMSKVHWVTVVLDGSVPTEELTARLDRSYELAKKKG